MTLEFEGGKYTYINDDSGQRVLRYGEPWREITGDKFIYLMASRIEQLERQLAERDAEIAAMEQAITSPENQPSQFGTVLATTYEGMREARNYWRKKFHKRSCEWGIYREAHKRAISDIEIMKAEIAKYRDAPVVASASVSNRTGIYGPTINFDYGEALRMAVPPSGKPLALIVKPGEQ